MPVKQSKRGFTIVEVMLVLALTGLLLVGVLGTTFSAIASQRYNDTVRSFAEYLRATYSEVISPESLGSGNSNQYAVLGKVLVFGHGGYDTEDDRRAVFSATLIGDAVLKVNATTFVGELAEVHAQLYCGQAISGVPGTTTTSRYLPLWQAELRQINDVAKSLNFAQPFSGTVIIARSPSSGAVHTLYTTATYDLRDGCADSTHASGSYRLQQDLAAAGNNPGTAVVKFNTEAVGICVKGDGVGRFREVRLAADGRNTSAVSILNADDPDKNGEVSRCDP